VADVEAEDGRYVMRAAAMIAAPVDEVRRLLADDTRLVEWVPWSEWVPGPVAEGEVRLGVGRSVGAVHFLGRTRTEPDGTVVRSWVMALPPAKGVPREPEWWREVRGTTRFVQGGTHVDVEVVTTIPGARARGTRAGARSEARGLDRALGRLARIAEGRSPGLAARLRGGPEAGPL
jgi:hypothetical protein